jgi:hypothetical protein
MSSASSIMLKSPSNCGPSAGAVLFFSNSVLMAENEEIDECQRVKTYRSESNDDHSDGEENRTMTQRSDNLAKTEKSRKKIESETVVDDHDMDEKSHNKKSIRLTLSAFAKCFDVPQEQTPAGSE